MTSFRRLTNYGYWVQMIVDCWSLSMFELQNRTTPLNEIDRPQLWQYFVGGFMLFSFLVSEVGNVFLIIGIYSSRLYSVTAKMIVALTITDMGLGMFVILPSCVTMVITNWTLGHSGCLIQGFLAQTFLSANCFLMLFLSIERFYLLLTKNKHKKIPTFCNSGIIAIFILSGLLSGFPLLQSNNYIFLQGTSLCVLSSAPFPLFLTLITYVIPMTATIFLSILILTKTSSCRRDNRIAVIPQSGVTVTTNRRSVARGSLFPTPKDDVIEETVISKTNMRETVALCYLIAPLSVLYCSAYCLKSLYTTEMNNKQVGLSLIIYAVAIIIQPFILFGFSGVLRNSFINLLRRRNDENHPVQFRLSRRAPCPREEIDRDVPNFLRQSSTMTIQAQISSQINQERNNVESRLSDTSSAKSEKSENFIPRRSQKKKFDLDRPLSVHTFNDESLESIYVNAGTSVSSASFVTINVPDLQMPCSRPRSRITRVMSETTGNEAMKGFVSPTYGFNSELRLKPSSVSSINLPPSKNYYSRGGRSRHNASHHDDLNLNLAPVENIRDVKQAFVNIPVTPHNSEVRSNTFVIRMKNQTNSIFSKEEDSDF